MEEVTVFEAHESYVLNLLFTRDNRTLISSGMDNVMKLWSVPDWAPVHIFQGHENSVNSISLAPDEKTLASGSTDATVRLWSFPDGELLDTLQDRKKTVAGVQISPDGQWVGAASYGGRVAIWTLSGEVVAGIKVSQKNVTSLDPGTEGVRGFAFAPDDKTLALGLESKV